MSKIFNKKTIVDFAIIDQINYDKLNEKQIEEIKKSSKSYNFPRAIFTTYLMDKDYNQLDTALHQLFYNNLPHEIVCNNCNDCQIVNNQKQIPDWNCGPVYIEFLLLKAIAAENLIVLIDSNRNILTDGVIQQLAVLFFTNAFEFKNLHSFFKVGEMVKYLTKEGFKEISKQLEEMKLEEAKKLIQKNYFAVKDEIINTKLGDPGYTDHQKLEKKFWENKREQFEVREDKPIKETFLSTFSEIRLKEIYEDLIKDRFIHEKTRFDIFKIVFSGKNNSSEEKIKWILLNREGNSHQGALREFLTFMTCKTIRQRVLNNWFTDARGKTIKLSKPKKNEWSNYYENLKGIIQD